jgi:hypothetical protein
MTQFLDYGIDKVDYTSSLPIPIIKEHNGIKVVRDDSLEGGTKRRAFTIYVKSKQEADEFVYASPRQGYAQLSLAYACKDLGKKCTVTVPKGKRYWLTDKAEELGCNIIEVPMGFLTNIQAKAKKYCLDNDAHLIPFGGDHPIIVRAMCEVAKSLKINPKEVWTVMSSGVLSRGLQMAWPDAKIYGVQIGHNTTKQEMGRAECYRSKYKFQQECKKDELPPFPSSLTYDSKAWSFIQENATKGALFWNVGK